MIRGITASQKPCNTHAILMLSKFVTFLFYIYEIKFFEGLHAEIFRWAKTEVKGQLYPMNIGPKIHKFLKQSN